MAIDLGPLSTATNAALSLSNLVLATPNTGVKASATQGYQPLLKPNPDGSVANGKLPPTLLFHYEGEQSFSVESDITDHYIENNTAIQDQIALKPEIVTTTGFIGELNDLLPGVLRSLTPMVDTLTVISAYAPAQSTTALNQFNRAAQLYDNASKIAQSAVAAYSSLSSAFSDEDTGQQIGNTGVFTAGSALIQNKQQQMFQQLYGYWSNRTLFNIQTPWAIITDMAIQSIKAVQDADNRMASAFNVTFKKIRTASTTLEKGGLGSQLAGRAGIQGAANSVLGTSAGESGFSLGGAIQNVLGFGV